MIIFNTEGVDAQVEVNKAVAKNYVDALIDANEYLRIENDLSLSHLLRLNDVFTVTKTVDDEEAIWQNVSTVAQAALENFVEMRETEGDKMYSDITARLDFIEDTVRIIEEKSPETTKNYREKLYAKLKELLSDNNIDEQRILTEAAIFSEKTAVDEETVRLKSHIV